MFIMQDMQCNACQSTNHCNNAGVPPSLLVRPSVSHLRQEETHREGYRQTDRHTAPCHHACQQPAGRPHSAPPRTGHNQWMHPLIASTGQKGPACWSVFSPLPQSPPPPLMATLSVSTFCVCLSVWPCRESVIRTSTDCCTRGTSQKWSWVRQRIVSAAGRRWSVASCT